MEDRAFREMVLDAEHREEDEQQENHQPEHPAQSAHNLNRGESRAADADNRNFFYCEKIFAGNSFFPDNLFQLSAYNFHWA